MGRPTNKETRRAQVADALIELLAHGSFEQITIQAIAKAAALAPGLVHHNFAGKDEVLTLAVERLALRLETRLAERLRARGDAAEERAHAFIDAWLAPGPGDDPRGVLAWCTIGDEARRRPAVRAVYLAALERSTARLAEAVSGPPRHAPNKALRALAQTLVVAIEGALRVGVAGGLAPGAAAPMVRALATALLRAQP